MSAPDAELAERPAPMVECGASEVRSIDSVIPANAGAEDDRRSIPLLRLAR